MIILIICLPALPIQAREAEKSQIAARIGLSSHIIYEDFLLYDLLVSYPLPKLKIETSRISLTGRIHATVGVLSAVGENGLLATIGPAIAWEKTGSWITFTGGINFAYVSRYEFGNAHIGGPVQFFSYFGIELLISKGLGVSYYFQHLSNADIYYHNPGMNLHSTCLSYHF